MAAEFAARQAQETQGSTERMQAKTSEVERSVALLDACFGRIDAVVNQIQGVRQEWETHQPDVKRSHDAGQVEEVFGALYTTETERAVLRAALAGGPLPAAQSLFEGNSVELF